MAPPVTRLELTHKHLPELHDITIEGDDSKEVFAHKGILVARSEYFCGMFNSAWSESSAEPKMPLPANIKEAVVDFLYKDDCEAAIKSGDREFGASVLVAANQYLIARLKEICGCHLTRVDDRKAVLGLFNAAYKMSQNQSDPSFPRLGQMVINYDPPLKKLSEEFVPHTRTLTHGLLSLSAVYPAGTSPWTSGAPHRCSGSSPTPASSSTPPTRTRGRVSICPSRPWRSGSCSGTCCATPS